MTPQDYPLTIYRGDSYRWTFVVWADADRTVPADLEGVSAAAEIQQSRSVTPLACTMTDNAIEVVLDAASSELLAVMAAAWDLQLAYPSGEIQTIIGGAVHITGDVTPRAVGRRQVHA